VNHGAKRSEKQGFTTYWFSFEFSVFYCRFIDTIIMPVACFDLFNTDDHIDRVYKELKEVCFIFIINIMHVKIVLLLYVFIQSRL